MSGYLRLYINALVLRQYRLERKLSSKDVAVSIGISPQTLSKIENAYYPPFYHILEKVLIHYNVTPAEHSKVVELLYSMHHEHLYSILDNNRLTPKYPYCKNYFTALFKDRPVYTLFN